MCRVGAAVTESSGSRRVVLNAHTYVSLCHHPVPPASPTTELPRAYKLLTNSSRCREQQTRGLSSGAAQQQAPLRNEQIKYPSMRVVYKDPATGAGAWKIMERKEAIEFAKSQSLDLILGEATRCGALVAMD